MRKLLMTATMAALLMAAPVDPVAWKLQNAPAAPVKAGARFNVKLLAEVQDGWHFYSLKPMAEGPIPTRIWIAEGQPFSLAGAVQSPDPQVMQDPSFGMEVELYEGEAVFTLPVRVAPGVPPGAQKLAVSASYQSCNNKLCLPPKTVKVELPIAIGK
jgi:thiol:disulfide interchange protein DsbD